MHYDIADICEGEDVELCIGLLPYKIEVVKTTPPEDEIFNFLSIAEGKCYLSFYCHLLPQISLEHHIQHH